MRATRERAGEAVDDVTAALLAGLAALTAHATSPAPGSSTTRIDRIAVLEQIRSALAAAQHAEMVAFGRQQVEEQIALVEADRLDPVALGRGIADQIAFACKVSPFHGSRRLGIARALDRDLPAVGALLAAGRISEQIAEIVVSQTSHLDPAKRRLVDKQLAATGLENLSLRRAESLVKRCAYDADRAGYVARGRTARKDRRVGLRPAPDTMSVLSGFLPVEQGVACLAALRAHADAVLAAGDERTRDQVMADTLIERVTGQATAADVNVEIGIVMPLESLLDPDDGGSAEIVGHGPVPAAIAHDLLASTEGKLWWRRLFTAPAGGSLVGCDPRRRRFDGVLAHLITVRDGGRCRDPFCDAPIRHLDHIDRRRAGGPTSFVNGRGTCARGNYVREMPGWRVEVIDDGLGERPHTVRTTTPTGHTYDSSAGPAP
ncbi:DUF222 domain-containing protein [uncultured Pseudonocardia sp.]|uniref:DUF222 domain-containing protein n=1 Tax=uncultured Pseudonocardia sp. TaxID=211455 RepID=UPI0026233633|nr:DUF222 domain-containing protein [uncultured Pseudonocardia sp.]